MRLTGSLGVPPLDRWFWLAMLIALVVVMPRTALITLAHNDTGDETPHIWRGMAIALGNPGHLSIAMNDPPFGDVINVLPALALGVNPAKPIDWAHWPGGKPAQPSKAPPKLARRLRIIRSHVLYGNALSPEAILMALDLWKAFLFVPFVAFVFHFGRWLYGMQAGWLAFAMVLIDPTFAGHAGLATLDVLAVEAIVLACYVGWRYFETPSQWRLIATAGATALAVSIKHTALAVPPILVCYWIAFVLRRKMTGRGGEPANGRKSGMVERENGRTGEGADMLIADSASRPLAHSPSRPFANPIRRRLNRLGLFILVFLFFLWASTLFDVSAPRNWMWQTSYAHGGGFHFMRDFVDPLLDLRWPGGIYIGSFLGGLKHSQEGHWSFLLGQNKPHGGWWYYFPVVASYKIPLGFFLVILLGIISLGLGLIHGRFSEHAAGWFRPHFRELSALIPIGIFCAMLFPTKIDIGFRHFLPPLVFIYILAARCVGRRESGERRTGETEIGPATDYRPVAPSPHRPVAIALLAWLGVAGALGHTLSYHPDYLSYINFPRKAAWRDIADSNIDWGQSLKQVRAWIDRHPTKRPIYLGYFFGDDDVRWYLDHRVRILHRFHGIPKSGILIISPNMVDSVFDYYDSFGALRSQKPFAIIGHNMLVYDLDKIHAKQTAPTTRQAEQ